MQILTMPRARELVDKIVYHKAMLAALNGSLIFQVHIRISSYQCGGVLLNHLYVATAAHCVHQAKLSQITVHLGEDDTKDTEEVRERVLSNFVTQHRLKSRWLHPQNSTGE